MRLGALKNVGVDAMRLIVDGRGDKAFATLFDLARRVDLKRVGKRPLEMLARAGAFDMLDPQPPPRVRQSGCAGGLFRRDP
jgi:DNA polymerase III subunit alpha